MIDLEPQKKERDYHSTKDTRITIQQERLDSGFLVTLQRRMANSNKRRQTNVALLSRFKKGAQASE